jgi:hypothetical protein
LDKICEGKAAEIEAVRRKNVQKGAVHEILLLCFVDNWGNCFDALYNRVTFLYLWSGVDTDHLWRFI